jgi:hypothetical protein
VSAAEERALRLNPVADDLTTAVIADWSELVNGALKAVENVTNTGGDDLEREIVVVPTHLTLCHAALPGRAGGKLDPCDNTQNSSAV